MCIIIGTHSLHAFTVLEYNGVYLDFVWEYEKDKSDYFWYSEDFDKILEWEK